ncbi:hypothetical protein R6V09_11495 [Streptomyces sp. W16]|uniref:hypothetical protein n=1 Tax=Streptomyces sp. W16 TaxID=3076631 RepID=UPI00295BE8E1|nr:hypothetical protein [Streptomyces sp. W16]MDV9170754.1 hypothetical protein [Streptomyces sp. W16]
MSSTSNNVDRRPDPGAPAHEHFEVVWRTSSDGAFKRAGLLAWEIIGIAVGLHSTDEVQPSGIEIREFQGPLVAGFAYGDDHELARRHTALVERRLWSCTVGEFLAFLRETTADPTAQPGSPDLPLLDCA